MIEYLIVEGVCMMKIAICDNEFIIQDTVKKYIQQYEKIYQKKYEIMCFKSGEELLHSKEHFHLIFLDIEMENMNGMETAEKIRQTDVDVVIVILSGYKKYKYKAYSLHVFDYLDKPFKEQDIYHVLQEVERYHRKQEVIYFSLRTKQGYIKLKKEDIVFIEYKNRMTSIHTLSAVYETTYTITQLMEKLENYDFYSPHRAFIVNLYHVLSYTSTFITLDNCTRTEIPISQLKAKEFKEKILQYLTKVATMI